MIFDSIYNKGFEAGYTKRECEDHEDQNRRLEDMLKYGKAIGKQEGLEEGFQRGYTYGYEEGKLDAKAEIGEIELAEVEA